MSKNHQYPVTVTWTGGREGSGAVTAGRSGAHSQLSVPPEFGGPGDGTNPEELFCSAVAACYSVTFGIIAKNRKLPLIEIKTKAVGEVEEKGAQFTYKKIVLKPAITLGRDATDAEVTLAEQMAHKADDYCIITNAVRDKVEIVIEPTVEKGR